MNPPARSRERLITVPFVIAFVANLLQGLALHGYLHLPGFLADLGAAEATIGFVFGVMSGAAIFIRPFAGRVMDVWGRRPVILAGGVAHLAACALYLTVVDVGPWLVAVRVLQGFAEGAIFSSLFTYAADIVPASRRTEGMGLFGVSGMLPISLGGLLGDVVLAHAGYRELFMVSVAIATVALLASLPLTEPEKPRGAPRGEGFFAALRQRDLMPIWFVGSAFATALAAGFVFLKRFVEEEQIGSVGLFFSTYAAAAILLRVFFGWVPDRLGPKRVFFPSMLGIGFAMGMVSIAHSDLDIAIAGVLAGIGHGYAFPILSAMVVDRANPSDRGSAVSLFTAVFDAGIFAGGPVLGWVAEAAGFRTMYLSAAALPLFGAVVFWLWDRRVEPRAAADG
ncbi:MAG: MFS transporter [Sandaracinaceae bacterium]